MPNTETYNIIIIGAGASGLMAGCDLVRGLKNVLILEARDRVGGRIHTISGDGFNGDVELSAEFVHGKLPLTLSLLDEAGIKYHPVGGAMWQAKDGRLEQREYFVEHWDLFAKKMKELEEDMTLEAFLDQYFAEDKYASLRQSARDYAAGFDNADPARASAIALRGEWFAEEDDHTQYRIDDGYGVLMGYLLDQYVDLGEIIFNAAVLQIQHSTDGVIVTTTNGEQYTAGKVIITAPINVLQQDEDAEGAIIFSPAIPDTKAALQKLGMGAVIKILLQFETAFWEDDKYADGKMKTMGFLFTREAIPTWWTQYPAKSTLLTGWVGGAYAAAMKDKSNEEILQLGLESLAAAFNTTPEILRAQLTASQVANWTNIPYSKGSYSYITPETTEARLVLDKPVNGCIYFAGEAFCDGPSIGTVEAALSSGRVVAEKILIGL